VVGLELFGETGLLRSLAVRRDLRGAGFGGRLVQAAEDAAMNQGATNLFLLTTTAEAFFGSRGYERCDRVTAPPAIKATAEFTSLCPSSAAFMRKYLAARPR
jgi:amino-acid N-acetyltransferase